MSEPIHDDDEGDEIAPRPSFRRSLGLFWLYTLLRFALFGVIWLILWLVGLGALLAAGLAILLSVPLSWVLLARPRRALAANIEDRVNSHVFRRAELGARLEGEPADRDSDDSDDSGLDGER